ncbi:hypothetical protein [Conexibacter sp. W3-3-2]|uniref:hypothetical protein n=1 Tax=Conexibacter sp. W3-3-2 TaxID=2675227 RepID=UPI001E63858B|nr:hypothetical protein [Conexibacter sp. W3-3-2]
MLDRVVDREQFDLVLDVSRPIPARVIGDMLGIPEEDDEKLIDWTNIFTAFEDPLYAPEPGQTDLLFQEILEYVGALVEQRVAAPTDDLLTALMDAGSPGRSSTSSSCRCSSCC